MELTILIIGIFTFVAVVFEFESQIQVEKRTRKAAPQPRFGEATIKTKRDPLVLHVTLNDELTPSELDDLKSEYKRLATIGSRKSFVAAYRDVPSEIRERSLFGSMKLRNEILQKYGIDLAQVENLVPSSRHLV
jgi:hypothetical protein